MSIRSLKRVGKDFPLGNREKVLSRGCEHTWLRSSAVASLNHGSSFGKHSFKTHTIAVCCLRNRLFHESAPSLFVSGAFQRLPSSYSDSELRLAARFSDVVNELFLIRQC